MKILVADSGSTKTFWTLFSSEGEVLTECYTQGLNPMFLDQKNVEKILVDELSPHLQSHEINEIYFYGAGCIDKEQIEYIKKSIEEVFHCKKISVESDLLGAARALCAHSKGIVCILGTGSNSCFYNGENIIQHISPLGYILGDEGSGAVLGKKLVADCLKNQLPKFIVENFFDYVKLSSIDIIKKIYKEPLPNRFLASLSPFLLEHIHIIEIYQLVFNNFEDFFTRNLFQYEDYQNTPIHIVGSIGFHYQNVLKDVAIKYNLNIEKILKDPMTGLIHFHTHQ